MAFTGHLRSHFCRIVSDDMFLIWPEKAIVRGQHYSRLPLHAGLQWSQFAVRLSICRCRAAGFISL